VAAHLFGLLFPGLLLGEELQVELLLLLFVIFLKLEEQGAVTWQALLAAGSYEHVRGVPWKPGLAGRGLFFPLSPEQDLGREEGRGSHSSDSSLPLGGPPEQDTGTGGLSVFQDFALPDGWWTQG
jgi:hypothetical protein